MSTKATKSDKLLPRVGSNEFKELHFKDQLYILNLFLHDKDKYYSLTGVPTPELEYVDKSLGKLLQLPIVPSFEIDAPISFAENCWCAYLSYFNIRWWEEGFSPLDELELEHQRVFGIQLFNLPLLTFDATTRKYLSYLVEKEVNDVFFYLVKMMAAHAYFKTDEEDPVDIWNLSVFKLNSYKTVHDINGDYPIIEHNERLIDLLEDESLVLLYSQVHAHGKRSFAPLIPSELYGKSQFKIKGWDFLVST
jgi:hypothetical protein